MLEDGDRAPDQQDVHARFEDARAARRALAEWVGVPAECWRCPARELRSRIRHGDTGGRTTSDDGGVW